MKLKISIKIESDKVHIRVENHKNENRNDCFIHYPKEVTFEDLEKDADMIRHNLKELIKRTEEEPFFDAEEAAEKRHWDNVATHNERFSGDDY